jgi:arginyl-tRNA synthetase
MFELAKASSQNPVDLAGQVAKVLVSNEFIAKTVASGPYVNLWLKDHLLMSSLKNILSLGETYGQLADGAQAVAVIEYSSPNVAKPFGINHLRSTVIGEALSRLFEAYGYIVVKDNHLGDWGTQFGNLLAAYEVYASDRDFSSLTMDELNQLYTRFSQNKKDSPELVRHGQECFAKLEAGDQTLMGRWASAFNLSQAEFAKTYTKLNVHFDTQIGEGFFVKNASELINSLPQAELKGLVEYDSTTQAVYINAEHPVMLRTSDGYCVYAARDLATVKFRAGTFDPSLMMVVVGEEQASYFRSVFKVANQAGLNRREDGQTAELEHVGFGLLLDGAGKKLSTRKGTSGKLEDVIAALDEKAIAETKQRNPTMSETEVLSIASKVAVGALIWNDLKNDRLSSVRFDIDSMLRLGGGSIIDVLYAYTRTCSILRKVGDVAPSDLPADFTSPIEHDLCLLLSEFSEVIRKSAITRNPHLLVNYLTELSVLHGRFYEGSRVIGEADEVVFNLRLSLHQAYKIVTENGLKLLNIPLTEKL